MTLAERVAELERKVNSCPNPECQRDKEDARRYRELLAFIVDDLTGEPDD